VGLSPQNSSRHHHHHQQQQQQQEQSTAADYVELSIDSADVAAHNACMYDAQ